MSRSSAPITGLLLALGFVTVAATADSDADALHRKLSGTKWVNSNNVLA